MEWSQIQYFQTVARTQHMTRSAEQLAISQPALSRAISRLEEELGAPLFERQGRNIVLNEYGKRFLYRVENAIQEIDMGKREIQDMIDPDHGTITLAFLHSLGIHFVPDLLSAFRRKHPNIMFQLSQPRSHIMREQLRSGALDLALFSVLDDEEGIRWEPIATEELYVIVSIDHPLAANDSIDLSVIEHEPFIAFKNGLGIRHLTDQLCKQAGFAPRITFEGEDILTVAGLVAAHLGVSMVPDIKGIDQTQIKLLRVTDPLCSRTIAIAWKESRYLSPVARRFLAFVKERYQD